MKVLSGLEGNLQYCMYSHTDVSFLNEYPVNSSNKLSEKYVLLLEKYSHLIEHQMLESIRTYT